MKPIDLTGLIKGLMVVIGIAMALGKMPELNNWAASQVMGAKQNFPKKPK